MSWFVIIHGQRSEQMFPMWKDEECEQFAMFETEEEANDVASQNRLAQACGYEVYEWP